MNFHAANKNIEWSGNDFMPEHVLFARKFAETVNINVDLSDQNFVEVSENFRNVKFDYICLHGVWSWISEENRKAIKLFISHSNVNKHTYVGNTGGVLNMLSLLMCVV